jgi:hypothetical protein
MSLTKVSYSMIAGSVVNVVDKGAIGDGVTNCTSAINAAIAEVSANNGGGVVFFPRGNYVATSTIYVPKNILLQGEGFFSGVLWNGVDIDVWGSCIVGKHTGSAIVSFKGAYGGGMRDMSVYGWPSTTPKTGIVVGRSTSASAGRHLFERVNATGSYTVAAWYAIASEESTYIMVHGNVLGGGAKYTMFISGEDDLSVDSLVSSSNWNGNTITGFNLLHQSEVNDSAVIRINIRAGTAGWTFTDGFTGMKSGTNSSHVNVHLVNATGDNFATDFVFENVGSESTSNASPPIQNYLISREAAAAPSVLNGFVVKNCSCGQTLGGTQFYIFGQDSVTINGAFINEAISTYPSSLWRVSNSNINLPQQNLTIRSGCSSSIVNAKNTFSSGVLGQVIKTMSLNTVIGPTIFTGGGPNVMVVSGATVFTGTSTPTLVVEIDGTTAPETFKWSLDGGSTFVATLVPITAGVDQLLQDGIYIRFSQGTGIALASRWTTVIAPVLLPTQTA